MSSTRRWALAGLIVAAQVGVVAVLAQSWQTGNAADPPCSVSCKRDTPPADNKDHGCPVSSCTGSAAVQAVAPPAALRTVSPPTLPPPAPLAGPEPPPVAIAPPPDVRPVPPSKMEERDTGAVMPTPAAPPPPPGSSAPSPVEPPTVEKVEALPPPPAPATRIGPEPTPEPPEMKPIEQTKAERTVPLPPAPEMPPEPRATTPPPPPSVEELPTPPPVSPAPPTTQQPKQEVACPWTLRIENVEGRAHLEARNGKEVQFRVVCAELDVQAPRGYIHAVGDVVVTGHEMHGTCKKLTINWHDEHVQLDGGVFLKCRKDGQEIEVKGEKLSFRLSVISTVRADTTSDMPVRRTGLD